MKSFFVWFIAIFITLSAAVYQRLTGPTYPKRIKIEVKGTEYKFKLLRSHGGTTNAPIELKGVDETFNAKVFYRRYPTRDTFMVADMQYGNQVLTGMLPNLPPAGKYEYYIELYKDGQTIPIVKDKHVVIRFKGEVPRYILFPHIFFMFFAMLLSNLAAIMAISKIDKYKFFAYITLICLTLGGLILGPLVQYFAFGEFWTGVPFGWDLTDNKTLIGFLGWLVAVLVIRKNNKPVFVVIAAVLLLLVYSIPHSMFGSELNPVTGEIIQGFIPLVF